MSGASVIVVLGRAAGLVVPQADGSFRFFASVREAFQFEGEVFRSAADASAAVRSILAPRRAHDVERAGERGAFAAAGGDVAVPRAIPAVPATAASETG